MRPAPSLPPACLLLVAMLAALAGCRASHGSTGGISEASDPGSFAGALTDALPVSSREVSIGRLYASFHASSTLTVDGDAQVPARLGGTVLEVLVEEGDSVKQGQLLARLDGERQRLATAGARARHGQRAAEYQRLTRLHGRGLVAEATVDGLRHEVAALEAAWKLEAHDLSLTEIRAPIAGIVSERLISAGQTLRTGQLAFRVTDPRVLRADLAVPQSRLSEFAVGQPVILRAAALPGQPVAARIDRIAPVVDQRDGTVRLTALIDNAAGLLAPGMFVRAEIRQRTIEDALVLPTGVIIEELGEQIVYVHRDGRAERRIVRTGARYGDHIQIIDGIREGEHVIENGRMSLRDGMPVRVIGRSVPASGA